MSFKQFSIPDRPNQYDGIHVGSKLITLSTSTQDKLVDCERVGLYYDAETDQVPYLLAQLDERDERIRELEAREGCNLGICVDMDGVSGE